MKLANGLGCKTRSAIPCGQSQARETQRRSCVGRGRMVPDDRQCKARSGKVSRYLIEPETREDYNRGSGGDELVDFAADKAQVRARVENHLACAFDKYPPTEVWE